MIRGDTVADTEVDTRTDPVTRVEHCDVCIIGAGYGGLNALFSATRHLTSNQRVILLDRRPRIGGIWVDTYPYVRLHQPHPMFTAGNIEWLPGHRREHLATRDEVLDHFEHCIDVLRQRVRIDVLLGWDMESHRTVDGTVRVTCRAASGKQMVITAPRLIKAYGYEVYPNDPLPVSSNHVRSVSPNHCDVRAGEMSESREPVWVIGGGKTAMDTAHALITRYPDREVNLVAGSGTYFARRDLLYPGGARRWFGGATTAAVGAEITARFDGTNEAEVFDWLRREYGTWVTARTGRYFAGVLSDGEQAAISTGLTTRVMDYFADVTDSVGAPQLVLRSGRRIPVEPGSWIVNCTGYLARHEVPYEPFVSPDGRVLSIQLRSAAMHFSSYAGYFLTHLLLTDELRGSGLYELDLLALREKAPQALVFAMFSLAPHNLSLIFDLVPTRVFTECGIDLDRWYPLPRRLIGTAAFMANHRRRRARQRAALDRLRERFDVRSGPLAA